MRSSLALLIAAIVCVLGCAGEPNKPSSGQPQATSAIDTASVRLVDLDGHAYRLRQALHDAITVVVFTRTDCPISNRYAPDIRELYETYHPRGVEFVLVYVDPRQQPDAIRRHLQEYEYPCSALRDLEHELAAATGATVTPEAVLFDADGEMVYRGRIDDRNIELGTSRSAAGKRDLADALEATLAGEPIAEPFTKAVGCPIVDLK
jgi:peroxiredoxin